MCASTKIEQSLPLLLARQPIRHKHCCHVVIGPEVHEAMLSVVVDQINPLRLLLDKLLDLTSFCCTGPLAYCFADENFDLLASHQRVHSLRDIYVQQLEFHVVGEVRHPLPLRKAWRPLYALGHGLELKGES